MIVRNVSEAKAQLSALLEWVRSGQEVILAKAGKPVAKLVAFDGPRKPRKPGAMAGKIVIHKDFDTWPDDIAQAFGIVDKK